MSTTANKRYVQVGLDRLVRLAWLERTSNLVLAGCDAPELKSSLQNELQGHFQSKNTEVRSSLSKTITILMKIWLKAPQDLEQLRADGLELLKRLPSSERVVIHWGMLMAVYPFWDRVAAHTGRLLRLQGHVAAREVQRRIREEYGERETAARRVRYVLRSFVDWALLMETDKSGVYIQADPLSIQDPSLIAWLVEASLHSRGRYSAQLRELLESPGLFPFQLKSITPSRIVAVSTRLECLHHGLDEDMIVIKDQP
jgi:hypothetical protein